MPTHAAAAAAALLALLPGYNSNMTQMEQANTGSKRKRSEGPQDDLSGQAPYRPTYLSYKRRLLQQWQQEQQQQQRLPVLVGQTAPDHGASSPTAAVWRSSSPASCCDPQQTEAHAASHQVVHTTQQAPATAPERSPLSPASRKKQLYQRYLQDKAAAAAPLVACPQPMTPDESQQAGAAASDCDDHDCDSDESDRDFSDSMASEGGESVYSEEEVTSAPCSSYCSSVGSAW
jgi:hypothetical protein